MVSDRVSVEHGVCSTALDIQYRDDGIRVVGCGINRLLPYRKVVPWQRKFLALMRRFDEEWEAYWDREVNRAAMRGRY